MPQRPFIAIADDFSGAAEIAGTLHRHGLSVQVTNDLGAGLPQAGSALAIDADTRRLTAREAGDKHQQLAQRFAKHALLLYKKTDSVLRGHISVELKALLRGLPHTQALFCPANPARSRTIKDGRYHVHGTPLDQTEFAQDPNFPIHTNRVTDILPEFTSLPVDILPSRGQLFIADATTEQDLQHWAATLGNEQLPAGASPFLAAHLQNLGHKPAHLESAPSFSGPALMISGSFSENSLNTANRFKKRNWPVIELTDERPAPLANFATRALVKLPTKKLTNPNGLPRRLALWLKQHLRRTPVAPAHLLIEGGDTAAAILQTFGWHDLHVLHQWEPGVVTLQPEDSAAPPITIKPGSYPWPREILTAR